MSRNFYEYSEGSKTVKEVSKQEPPQIKIPTDGQDELGVLSELNSMLM